MIPSRSLVFAVLCAALLPAQDRVERMRDLGEDQAAGKVRWLQQRWDAGEIDVDTATRSILEGFEHPWIGVRIVVAQHITTAMDPKLVHAALIAELARFRSDFARLQPGISGDLLPGSRQVWAMMFQSYTRELIAKATAFADDEIVAALITCADSIDPADESGPMAPALLAGLTKVGTRDSFDAAIRLFDRMESAWRKAWKHAHWRSNRGELPDQEQMQKLGVHWQGPPVVFIEDVLRALHEPLAAGLRDAGAMVPDFSPKTAAARRFASVFKRIKAGLPEHVERPRQAR